MGAPMYGDNGTESLEQGGGPVSADEARRASPGSGCNGPPPLGASDSSRNDRREPGKTRNGGTCGPRDTAGPFRAGWASRLRATQRSTGRISLPPPAARRRLGILTARPVLDVAPSWKQQPADLVESLQRVSANGLQRGLTFQFPLPSPSHELFNCCTVFVQEMKRARETQPSESLALPVRARDTRSGSSRPRAGPQLTQTTPLPKVASAFSRLSKPGELAVSGSVAIYSTGGQKTRYEAALKRAGSPADLALLGEYTKSGCNVATAHSFLREGGNKEDRIAVVELAYGNDDVGSAHARLLIRPREGKIFLYEPFLLKGGPPSSLAECRPDMKRAWGVAAGQTGARLRFIMGGGDPDKSACRQLCLEFVRTVAEEYPGRTRLLSAVDSAGLPLSVHSTARSAARARPKRLRAASVRVLPHSLSIAHRVSSAAKREYGLRKRWEVGSECRVCSTPRDWLLPSLCPSQASLGGGPH